jgi:inorganic pyrophosphatase
MDLIRVVIETPRHTAGKYYYEEDGNCYLLKKILPLGMVFPYDLGMIKGTRGEDGDPLDAMVISEMDTYPGVEINCRVIGALLATQVQRNKETIRNDRFFFIPETSVSYEHMTDIKDFSKRHNEQLERFFINYNEIEKKQFKPLKWISAVAAGRLLGKELH